MGKSIFEIDKTNVKVEFNIIGDNFSPDFVTQKLKINPTEVWIKGEQIKDKDLYRKHTLWSISTEYEESLDINDQLETILSVLAPKTLALIELRNTLGVEYRFCVVISIENSEKPAMYLDTDTIRFLSEIVAEIYLKKLLRKRMELSNKIIQSLDVKYNMFSNNEEMSVEDNYLYSVQDGIICETLTLIEIINRNRYISKNAYASNT